MKAKNSILNTVVMTLITAQLALQAPAALAASANDDATKNPAQCDLRIRPERELVNTKVVGQIEGKWDYTGRNYWHDVGMVSTGLVLAPIIFVGFALIWDFYDEGVEYEGWAGEWGERARQNRTRNSEQWYAQAKKKLSKACNKYLKKKYKKDIIDSDGLSVTAEHYACTEPREEGTVNGIRLVIDVVRGDPVYKDLSFDELQAKRCNKLLGCSARSTSDEALDWIARKQMELGCS
ncbi:MAG: hypothetical protein A2X94_11675 [Bdellovibrionales bacterium GWB1_55_8]|nr:MAG: hypothetical protein A2X94_11675 [Bdellovibrionales bacterium GWB1_55_8]